MVDIIAPRRGESIVAENGVPTRRFFEYLEASTTQSNNTVEGTEVDISTVQMAIAQIADLQEQIDELKLLVNLNGNK